MEGVYKFLVLALTLSDSGLVVCVRAVAHLVYFNHVTVVRPQHFLGCCASDEGIPWRMLCHPSSVRVPVSGLSEAGRRLPTTSSDNFLALLAFVHDKKAAPMHVPL